MGYSLLIAALIVALVTVGFGDYFARTWIASNNWKDLGLSIAAYLIQMSCWYVVLREVPKLAKMTLIWSVVMTLAGCFIGLAIFKEHLNMMNIVGACLAIASLILLAW